MGRAYLLRFNGAHRKRSARSTSENEVQAVIGELGFSGRVPAYKAQLVEHGNAEGPDSNFGTSNFGQIFGAKRAREIEIALKYSF